MMVREGRAAGRARPPSQAASLYSFASPMRGIVLDENLARAAGAGAVVLDNWVCTSGGVRVRGGAFRHATVPAAVQSMFVWRGSPSKMFAATASAIYDVTAPGDPLVPPAAAVSGLSSGAFSTVQFGTAGGSFIYAVNGANNARLFDGSTWTEIHGSSIPAIMGVATSTLAQVWSHGRRLWFAQKDTLTAWYLPVESIGGAAVGFNLRPVFRRGGSLMFGASWSLDAGDGLDDKCVFVTTEGEVAIYEGNDPSSAADWRLVGRYDLPRPVGRIAHVSIGGDLLIATVAGIVRLSAAIGRESVAIEESAITRPIAPIWLGRAKTASGAWSMLPLNGRGYMIASAAGLALVMNLRTGAWSRFPNWDVQAQAEADGEGYFGDSSGRIFQAERGGQDGDEMYVATFVGQHEALGVPGALKIVHQLRTTLQTANDVRAQVFAVRDFGVDLPPPPDAPSATVDGWDVGAWDGAEWDAGGETRIAQVWSAAGVSGTYIAPGVQISVKSPIAPVIELVSVEAAYTVGAAVA